ncbi:MAG TPA: Ig-like domain-containing protein, partial [Kofleriaceae bacterium]
MASLRSQLCILFIALSGCALDYRDDQWCAKGADCLDGYTCSFDSVCELPPTPPSVNPIIARVVEGQAAQLRLPPGDAPFGNLQMQYGSLQRPYYDPFVDDPITGVLEYTAASRVFDHDYIDKGSFDLQYTRDLSVAVPIEITVTLDHAPTLNGDAVEVMWNTPKNFYLYPSDVDPYTTGSQYSITTQPAHGSVTAVEDSFGPTGELSYVPVADYFGPDSFDVTLSDGVRTSVGTVTLDVTCGDAVADEATKTWFDASPIDVAANDTITNTTLEIAGAPANGTATIYNGQVVYHATRGFVGDDTFTYRASRTEGCSATATVTVHVTNPVERIASGDYNREGALSTNGNVVAYVGQGLTQDNVVWVWTGGSNLVAIKNRFGDEPAAATRRPHLSGDGRYVVFDTQAPDMVAAPAVSGLGDVYLFDRMTGTTELISVGASGGGNNESYGAQVSDDGRYVSFVSVATDLVPGDANGVSDVFVRDRQTGTTELVSVSSSGMRATTGAGRQARMSANGRIVAFT